MQRYIPNAKTIEYFDSLAEEPNEDITNFLKNFKNIKRSKSKLQASYETSCGPYTIYFLVNRCKGQSFEHIVKSINNPFSDVLVKYFIYKLYR